MPLVNPGAQPESPSFGHRYRQTSSRKIPSPLQGDLLFLLLLFVSYAILLFYIKPVDAINDDWGMYSILSGAYTGTPDAHVMFFLYPLSWALSRLYSLWSFVPWYGLFQHAVQILCLFTVYRRILRIRQRHNPQAAIWPPALTAFILLFFIINLNVMAEAQYTTTAGLAPRCFVLPLPASISRMPDFFWITYRPFSWPGSPSACARIFFISCCLWPACSGSPKG